MKTIFGFRLANLSKIFILFCVALLSFILCLFWFNPKTISAQPEIGSINFACTDNFQTILGQEAPGYCKSADAGILIDNFTIERQEDKSIKLELRLFNRGSADGLIEVYNSSEIVDIKIIDAEPAPTGLMQSFASVFFSVPKTLWSRYPISDERRRLKEQNITVNIPPGGFINITKSSSIALLYNMASFALEIAQIKDGDPKFFNTELGQDKKFLLGFVKETASNSIKNIFKSEPTAKTIFSLDFIDPTKTAEILKNLFEYAAKIEHNPLLGSLPDIFLTAGNFGIENALDIYVFPGLGTLARKVRLGGNAVNTFARAADTYNSWESGEKGTITLCDLKFRNISNTIKANVTPDCAQANNNSQDSSISANGRYIAFYSDANNLVNGNANNSQGVFVYDRQTGQTQAIANNDGHGYGTSPSISANGRYVAFESWSNNLISDDANNVADIFVYDLQEGQIQRVSVASDGTQGNKGSSSPSISANGRYVAFGSDSDNLVSGDTNNVGDVFVYDRQTGQIQRVSMASDGTQGNDISYSPSISGDGRYIAFVSYANNLVSGDTNNVADVFVYDIQVKQIQRVSVADDGTQGNKGPIADIKYSPSISADGRYVVFASRSDNLVSGDINDSWDVFVYAREKKHIQRVSVASNGRQGNGNSYLPSISADGSYISFSSDANNLVTGDDIVHTDIFVRYTGINNTSN